MISAVAGMMRKGGIPGLSVAVVDRHRTLWAAGFGMSDRAAATPATASTTYLWFSMTKLVTATAALRLADEGRLDVDAPAHEYVHILRAPGRVQPSVRQLLTHTAGLANPLPIRWVHAADASAPDPASMLARLVRHRRAWRYPVGQSARYSNVGYLAAGQAIAEAAGMPFEDYVRQAVLRPVGMNRTGFGYPSDADAAVGYIRCPRVVDPVLRRLLPHGVAGNRHGSFLALHRFYVDGPAYGGLVGDVLDAARFLRMHLRDGELDGHRVLAPGTARMMRRLDYPGKPFDHATGWFRRPTSGGENWVEHFGAGAGFWNVMRLYPDRGIGVVAMANTTTPYDFDGLFALLSDRKISR